MRKRQEYDELLAYAVDYVGNNPKVVSGIFKEWLANDAAKTNEANVAAQAGATLVTIRERLSNG